MVTRPNGRGACMECPVCHSSEVEFTDEEFSDEETEIHYVVCNDCGARITETWKASSWAVSAIKEEDIVDEDCEIRKFRNISELCLQESDRRGHLGGERNRPADKDTQGSSKSVRSG